MRTLVCLFVCLLSALWPDDSKLLAQTSSTSPPRPRFDPSRPGVHDPVLAKEGDTYHLFATGRGIDHLTSKNLKTWERAQPVFASSPAWVLEKLPEFRNHIWAPDILSYRGRYHLFYSCSAFGKNTSAIGHAVTDHLDSAVWTDLGPVLESVPERDRWNAIDPNVIVDEQGVPWMSFGSFWDGIKLVRLKDDLSGLAQPQEWHSLCRRPRSSEAKEREPGENAVEAPFLFRHDGRYYLFVSYDYCCKGKESNYRVVVGRSERIQGPYLDMEGQPMMSGGGSTILSSSDEFVAAGHCGVYRFDGTDYLVAHGYSKAENGAPKLVLRVVEWDSQGWPVLTE